MMLPALLMLRVGSGKGVPVPIPLLLLWPLLLPLILVVALLRLFTPSTSRVHQGVAMAWMAVVVLFHLHGLKVDVWSQSGERVYFRVI